MWGEMETEVNIRRVNMGRLKCIFSAIKILFAVEKLNTIIFILAGFLELVLVFVEMYLIKYVVDTIRLWNGSSTFGTSLKFVALLGGLLYFKNIVGTAKGLSTSRLIEIALYEQERMIIDKTTKLSICDIESPKIKTYREKASVIRLDFIVDQGMNYITSILQLCILLYVVTTQGHWIITTISLVIFVVQLKSYSHASQDIQNVVRGQASSRKYIRYLVDILTNKKNAQELRIFGISKFIKSKWETASNKNMNEVLKQSVKGEATKNAPDIIIAVLSGISIAVLIVLMGVRGESPGKFTLLFQMTALLFTEMGTISLLHGNFKTYSMVFSDFINYLELDEEKSDIEISQNELGNRVPLSIRVDVLSFKYPDNPRQVLKDISFEIRDAQKVAIVGENGSGKSTVVKMLLGLYKPTEGNIVWRQNGENIDKNKILSGVRIVFQDYIKMLRSIRENIAIGQIDKINNDNDIDCALHKARAEYFIPNKDTQIGPQFNGQDLSGGQWQKIAASRAYMRDGICTIFDEPTAALDPYAELEIFKTFLELVEDQTAIIVTHRIGVARLVDWIIVMKDGMIAEQGTHDTLINKNGEYSRLYNLQSTWYS